MKNSYHKTDFGSFGDNLICDIDGFTYTTTSGWLLDANVDTWEVRDEDWAMRMAQESRDKIEEALAAGREWRKKQRN
jgi:hypothetical protein